MLSLPMRAIYSDPLTSCCGYCMDGIAGWCILLGSYMLNLPVGANFKTIQSL